MAGALLLGALGCATPAPPSDPGERLALRTWLEGPSATGGVLVVQLEAPADVDITLPEPEVRGLELRPKGDARAERIGDHLVVTRRYGYAGSKGRYRIPSLEAQFTDAAGEQIALSSSPLYLDLGMDPPREEQLVDIAEPEAVWTFPWGLAAVAGGLAGLLGGGIWVAFRGTATPAATEPEAPPPDVVALRAWERARKDPLLDDFGKALAISRIFREYAEAVLRFPATAWTTSEIVEHLTGLTRLPEGNVPRARRLLRATDRVKYADEAAREHLFDDLDADLRGFVESTRPRQMTSVEAS